PPKPKSSRTSPKSAPKLPPASWSFSPSPRIAISSKNFTEPAFFPLRKSAKLAGKSFAFTGGLANRSREEAGELVLQHGGKVSGSVSKKTDYVVVGTDPGSKYEKAKELGVAILSETEFEKLVGVK